MAARRGTGLARWPLRLAWCCYVLCRAAWALDSRTCREVVTEAYRRHQDDKAHCEDVLCGRLDAPADAQGFLSRLTPQCRDVMARYRFRCTCCEHGRSAVRPRHYRCAVERRAFWPTNPVVVQGVEGVANFAFCALPKAGSTSFRQLLLRLNSHPNDVWRQGWEHFAKYPTLWHYHHVHDELSDRFPLFIMGRNPYFRLLSGYLDKMVITAPKSHDRWNLNYMNTLFRAPNTTMWNATRESFRAFVTELAMPGRRDRNEHFALMGLACQTHDLPYVLRLEEVTQWFPCFVNGLKLLPYVEEGWERYHYSQPCWWKPANMTCGEFYAASKLGDGTLVPLDDASARDHVVARDAHDVGAASKWQQFYDQALADSVYDLYRKDFDLFGYERLRFVPQDLATSFGTV